MTYQWFISMYEHIQCKFMFYHDIHIHLQLRLCFFLKGIKHLVLWRVALLLVFLEVPIYYFSWVEIITVLAKGFWRSLSQNRFGIHTSFEVGPYLVVFTYMNRIVPDDCLLKTNHKEWMRNQLQKCWLEHWPMVGVLVLHLERSGSSDSSSKTYVVHLVLPIAITWREVDEPTLETPFFIQKKKNNSEVIYTFHGN